MKCLNRFAGVLLVVGTTLCHSDDLKYPPALPNGVAVVTDTTNDFLTPPSSLRADVLIAKTAPTVDFLYYPEQNYVAKTWSVWGDSLVANGKYYSSIGDHNAPRGNAWVFEYDPVTKKIRTLVSVQKFLNMPAGHYVPGKIHSRIDLGRDGWLYFSTHRGSTRITTDEYHYKGDWVLRTHPKSGKTEVVVHAPVSKHCIPTGMLDPERLIFYGGTASGDYKNKEVRFFAYDAAKRKLLQDVTDGPYRYMIHARSSGRVYYVNQDEGPLMRYDPATNVPPQRIPGSIGLRAATQETNDGFVYTVSTRRDGRLWRFNTRTERIDELGHAAVGELDYVASIDVDPTGRYLYYVPGAHGGAPRDGSPVVQFDVKTRRKKVIAFLHPFYEKKYGYVPIGTYGSALSQAGDKLFITWNGNRAGPGKRGQYGFDTCAMTVVHIPKTERE